MERVYELAQTYIKFDIEADEKIKDTLESYLLYWGKTYAREVFGKDMNIDEFYFAVEFDKGSLKTRLFVLAASVYGFISNYGDFRSGLDAMVKDAKTFSEYVITDASKDPYLGTRIINAERRLGAPGKIKRLYSDLDKLQNDTGNLSPNQRDEIIARIRRNLDNLVFEIDVDYFNQIMNDVSNYNIPLDQPNKDDSETIPVIPGYAILPGETRIVSEEEIGEPQKKLPAPK